MKNILILALILSCIVVNAQSKTSVKLIEVARSEKQWTGVAVAHDGRIFVNYPRWSKNVTTSVAYLDPIGEAIPFPNIEMNQWNAQNPIQENFVCVQSVVVDNDGYLWIVDAGNPEFQGVIAGCAKVFKVDLQKNQIVKKFLFDDTLLEKNSYLNDIRVDTKLGYAYLTDSGAGAIIVLNTETGECMRRLHTHFSTKAEDTPIMIHGQQWLLGGTAPQVHSDGIALTPNGEYLYYQSLTGRTLYKIATQFLRDSTLTESQLGEKVKHVGKTGIADGIEFDANGILYLSGLEESAIKTLYPDGTLKILLASDDLAWPDSFAVDKNGMIYVTTSQIHLGEGCKTPYKIFKIIR